MARTKKAAKMSHSKKASKMRHSKKAAKFAKYKKNKRLPLDSTPWEELSKNIKGKFKSKIKTPDEHQNKCQLLVSEEYLNDPNIDKLNNLESNIDQLKEVSPKHFNETKPKKKKKLKTEKEISIKNITTYTEVNENNQDDISAKSEVNNECEFPNANSPVKKLSKSQRKKLKRRMKKMSDSSPSISAGNSNSPIQSEPKKIPNKKKLEKRKFYEKQRLERRKELGIMSLPKHLENRLMRKRKILRKKEFSPEEIKNIMRKERSKAQEEFRKSNATQICFNCRQPGHLVTNCPSNEDNATISICLKCGSTDHKYTECNKNISGFPFAMCFICKNQGHISRDCPNNEHGIYPKGGKCTLCDSIKHLRKDCPTLKINKKNSSVTLHTIDNSTSIDHEVIDVVHVTSKTQLKEPKIVTF